MTPTAPGVEIGIGNARMAYDQLAAYPTEQECYESYLQNAMDTAIEEGLGDEGWHDSCEAFIAEYRRLTGKQF